MTKTKVLISVKGGNVQHVASNNDIDIVIIDYDNIDRGDSPVGEPMKPDAITNDIYSLYMDQTDPVEMEIRDELKRIHF